VGRSFLSYLSSGDAARDFDGRGYDVVVFALGTNDANRSLTKTCEAVATARSMAGSAKTLYVGAPALEAPDMDARARAVAQCAGALLGEAVDVRAVGCERAPDGVHFSRAGAECYGEALGRAVLASEALGGGARGKAAWWIKLGGAAILAGFTWAWARR
jgi:lysophospholipase L1-like esterase